MYKVIEMYGDYEPWWFLDGWENNIVNSWSFDNYYDALKHYKSEWLKMSEHYPQYKSRSDLMTIFWESKDQRWCEECDEFLQQYHSLALLENETTVSDEKLRPGYSKQNATEHFRTCKIRKNDLGASASL